MQIKNPCPVAIQRMDKKGDQFFCNSCQKDVIDFRDKSIDEIKQIISYGGCGIFNPDQMTHQKTYGFFHRTLFYGLALISFIGFNIKPLTAQTTDTIPKASEEWTVAPPFKKSVSSSDNTRYNLEKNPDAKQKKTKHKKFRRGIFRKRALMGCPSF